jgi:UDP:flavonoid glycosyltransferase YjiC (YdhE family)
MRLPSLLVPYPTAADNHQFFNASAFEKTGAAKMLEQKNSTPEKVASILTELVENDLARSEIKTALAQWCAPKAAEQIAENILQAIGAAALKSSNLQAPTSRETSSSNHQTMARAGIFGACFLVLLWSLEVGAWSFFRQ